jgi:hypothetical protein
MYMATMDHSRKYEDMSGRVAVLDSESGAFIKDEIGDAIRIASSGIYERVEMVINGVTIIAKPFDNKERLYMKFKRDLKLNADI